MTARVVNLDVGMQWAGVYVCWRTQYTRGGLEGKEEEKRKRKMKHRAWL